tara:strand:- start:1276 stop:2178 length:903 start_codon:yes stop_codon:yes gene_type:complete
MIFLPKNVDLNDLLKCITDLSWEVLKILKSYSENIKNSKEFHRNLNIINHDSGPVTLADIEISEFIKNKLIDKFPLSEWDFLSEEDAKNDQSKKFESKWIWIIDPIDGTKDFINQTGEFAVHIALLFEKKIILGVVPVPAKDEIWISCDGIGTWCESNSKDSDISICKNSKSIESMTILTSKSHLHSQFEILLKELHPKKIIGMGSIGYKVVSILKGEGDLYISYSLPKGSCPKDWDVAGPMALLKSAGGHFTNLDGYDLDFLKNDYKQSGVLIASLSNDHQSICSKIKDIMIREKLEYI